MSDSDFTDIDNARGLSDQERRIRRQVRREADFYKHLATYVLVISLLWFICIATLPDGSVARMLAGEMKLWRLWAIWPTLGWGIGIVLHGLGTMPAFNRWGSEWEERKVQEILARDRSRG